MLKRRTLARLGAASAAGLLITATAAAPASAHVTITPSGTAAGDYTVLTFSVGHGCEGSPTTQLDIKVPDEILAVTPTELAGWRVEKQMVALDEPVEDAHGNSLTERVGRVVYTADRPLRDGYRAAMELSLQLPAAPGETLVFPVVQKCVQGENPWVEVPAEGQSTDDFEFPAPTVEITEGEAVEGTDDTEPTAATPTNRTVEVESDTNVALGLGGLAAGMIAVVIALMALTRSRREP